MGIHCDHCDQEFEPTTEQSQFISESKQKGMTFIMLRCVHCGLHTAFNPSQKEVEADQSTLFRCPQVGCSGFVVSLDDGVWGCGECGTDFQSDAKLFEAIESISVTHPYRARCYARTCSGFRPVLAKDEPTNYQELVESELW